MIFGEVIDHGDSVDIEWGADATEWHKEAAKEYGATSAKEVEQAFEWREEMDALESENPEIVRVMRGKHPTKDKDIGRPRHRGNRTDHVGND